MYIVCTYVYVINRQYYRCIFSLLPYIDLLFRRMEGISSIWCVGVCCVCATSCLPISRVVYFVMFINYGVIFAQLCAYMHTYHVLLLVNS